MSNITPNRLSLRFTADPLGFNPLDTTALKANLKPILDSDLPPEIKILMEKLNAAELTVHSRQTAA